MSTVRANAILDASGGNTATINSMTPTADSLQGFRNRIINGDMRIDQRNAGAAVSAGNAYTLDRWAVRTDTGSGNTTQQSTTVPTGFKNSLIVTIGTGASPTSGQRNYIQQNIEGLNVSDLAWGSASAKTVTLSFWVRSSLTGTFGGALQNSAGDRSYPFTYTISAANTYEYKTVTIAGDTTGTWLTTNGIGIALYIGLGLGSTFNGTAGAWAAADYRSATGSTNVVATSGATFYITGVQLEVGSVATPFERRDYGRELIMCQRYYETSFNAGTAPANNVTDNFSGTQTAYTANSGNTQNISFKVTKRASATITYYSSNMKASPTANQWQYYNGSAWVDATSTQTNRSSDSFFNAFYVTSGFSAGQSTNFFGGWAASAEI